jgi:hypothetical protein
MRRIIRVHSTAPDQLQLSRVRLLYVPPMRCVRDKSFVRLGVVDSLQASVSVHADCVCNELAALHTRVGTDGPAPSAVGLAALSRVARRIKQLLRGYAPAKWDVDKVVEHAPAHNRELYRKAAEDLSSVCINKRLADVQMFVKPDKFDRTVTKVMGNKPLKARAIQARSVSFNLLLGQFIKPIEQVVYRLRGWRSPSRTRLIAKCLNWRQRARLLQRKLSAFTDPEVFVLDASSFDASIRPQHLNMLHGVYLSMIQDPVFARLLSYRLKNRVTSKHGIRYETDGKRMSGDVDTALGNCLNMVMFIAATMDIYGCRRWDLLNDGDDCLVIVERGACTSAGLQWRMAQMGVQCEPVRVQATADSMELCEACRSKPVKLHRGWSFVRIPQRSIATFLCSYKYHHERKGWLKFLATYARCELHASLGVPCLQTLAWHVFNLTRGIPRLCNLERHEFYQRYLHRVGKPAPSRLVPDPISMETRLSFEKAFGISPVEQVRFEAAVETLTLDDLTTFEDCYNEVLPYGSFRHLWTGTELYGETDH